MFTAELWALTKKYWEVLSYWWRMFLVTMKYDWLVVNSQHVKLCFVIFAHHSLECWLQSISFLLLPRIRLSLCWWTIIIIWLPLFAEKSSVSNFFLLYVIISRVVRRKETDRRVILSKQTGRVIETINSNLVLIYPESVCQREKDIKLPVIKLRAVSVIQSLFVFKSLFSINHFHSCFPSLPCRSSDFRL